MNQQLSMLKQMMEAYVEADSLHARYYQLMTTVRDAVKKGAFTLETMVDVVYVGRLLALLWDDLRKEMDGFVQTTEMLCCALYVDKHVNDPSGAEPIHGRLATGTPKVHLRAKLPKASKDPEAYAKFMAHLGIDADLVESGLVKPHWPKVQDHVSNLAEQGQPLPPGIDPDATYPTYSLTVRQQEDVTALLEAALEEGEKIAERYANEAERRIEQTVEEMLTPRHNS